jgi:hypothetical protein
VVIWQLFAGIAATALLATTIRLPRKSRRPSQILLVLLLVPIPAAGFVLYAIDPGPLPSVTLATWLDGLVGGPTASLT